MSKPATPLPRDILLLDISEELDRLLPRPEKPVLGPKDREVAIMRDFLKGLDWDSLENDLNVLQDLQAILNRRNEDATSEALSRVVELFEDITDTAESCGLK